MRLSAFRPAPCPRTCFTSRYRFWIALAISLCMHLLFLFPPHWIGWHSPRPLPEISRLNVTLKPAQPAQPLPPPAPAAVLPAPPQTSIPASAPSRAAPVDAPPPVPVDAPPEPEATDAPALAGEDGIAAPEEIVAFSPGGTMRYIVYRGDQGFEVGRAELQWQIDDGSYRLNLHTETSGVAALLYPVAADAESWGHFSAEGLRPDRYTLTPTDKDSEEVSFNWEIQKIEIGTRNPRPQPIHPGSQDLLSLQFQFAYLISPPDATALPRGPLEFWIATDKRYELFRFVILGEEIQELPAGSFRTLHLQSVGSNKTIDFWLAEDYQMLPVKTRFTDKRGDIYEQAVSEIVIENDVPVPPVSEVDPEAPLTDIPPE